MHYKDNDVYKSAQSAIARGKDAFDQFCTDCFQLEERSSQLEEGSVQLEERSSQLEALGLWKIISKMSFNADGSKADEKNGLNFIELLIEHKDKLSSDNKDKLYNAVISQLKVHTAQNAKKQLEQYKALDPELKIAKGLGSPVVLQDIARLSTLSGDFAFATLALKQGPAVEITREYMWNALEAQNAEFIYFGIEEKGFDLTEVRGYVNEFIEQGGKGLGFYNDLLEKLHKKAKRAELTEKLEYRKGWKAFWDNIVAPYTPDKGDNRLRAVLIGSSISVVSAAIFSFGILGMHAAPAGVLLPITILAAAALPVLSFVGLAVTCIAIVCAIGAGAMQMLIKETEKELQAITFTSELNQL